MGRWQAIQYEVLLEYCSYCKHQGHISQLCNIERRDEEYKKRKEPEAANKIKGKKTADASNQVIPQTSPQQINANITASVSGVDNTQNKCKKHNLRWTNNKWMSGKLKKGKITRVNKAMVSKINSINQ